MDVLRPFSRLKTPPWGAVSIATAFLILAIIYSVVNPVFEASDEIWHYPFVWHVAQTGTLPIQDPSNPQLWNQEGSQPPLYYVLMAVFTKGISNFNLADFIKVNPYANIGIVTQDKNINMVLHTASESTNWSGAILAVHITRLLSLLLGLATVLTVYATARLLWQENQLFAYLAMMFVAFNPMYLFISASVNNDNLITLLASLVLWRTLVFINLPQKTPKQLYPQFIILGILIGLAGLTKVTGLGLLPLVMLALLWWGWKYKHWKITITGMLIIIFLATISAGWWYYRNFNLYGDWTGTKNMVAMMGARTITPTIGQLINEIPGMMRSFWGLFGGLSIGMPSYTYWGLNFLLLTGFAGALIFIIKAAKNKAPTFYRTWWILALWLLLLITGLISWTMRTPASQGRLLFPAIGAIAILWSAGWVTIIPKRWQFVPVMAMLALAVWVPWGVIQPAYAQPAFVDAVPSSAQRIDATFGDAVRLLAYESDSARVQPNGTLPVTLYWQRNSKPIAKNYTLFVHLLDDNDLVIAQRDMFHGLGNYPTGQWDTDKIFADTYVLKIPQTTFAPARARFEVGIYDRTTGMRLPLSTGGDNIRFGSVDIRAEKSDHIPNPQNLQFDDNIALVGYTISPRRISGGERVTLTLYWQSNGTPTQNYKVFVHLTNRQNVRVGQDDSEPQQGNAPTAQWTAGQIIVDAHELNIAPNAPAGAYQFVVGLYNGETGERLGLRRNGRESVQADAITLGGVRIDGE